MTPRPLLIALFAMAGVPLALGIFFPAMGQVGVLLTVLVLLAAIVDLVISPRPARVEVWREAGDVMSVGTRNAVRIGLRNRNAAPVALEVHDEPPLRSEWFDLPASLEAVPNRTHYLTYHVQPQHRGKGRFGKIDLRSRSRLTLWTLWDERDLEQPVHIFPNIQAVHAVELLARQNRLAEAGVRLSRIRGRGTEFDRLREYRREDEYRNIDWKATARQQQLISREYVVERNQNVLFLLDAGRSMCNEAGGITHFDRALNAAILLSYVALRQGDTVGMLVFSNRAVSWVPPVHGATAVQKLIRQTYELEPSYDASDYALMVEELRRRHRKRSLVVLVTHALDEVHLESIGRHVRELRTPHLVLGAFLRNAPLHERVTSFPRNDLEAFQVAAAAEMVASQTLQIAELEKSGLLVIDALPEQLSSHLVSRYLDVKARHLL